MTENARLNPCNLENRTFPSSSPLENFAPSIPAACSPNATVVLSKTSLSQAKVSKPEREEGRSPEIADRVDR